MEQAAGRALDVGEQVAASVGFFPGHLGGKSRVVQACTAHGFGGRGRCHENIPWPGMSWALPAKNGVWSMAVILSWLGRCCGSSSGEVCRFWAVRFSWAQSGRLKSSASVGWQNRGRRFRFSGVACVTSFQCASVRQLALAKRTTL